MRFLKEERGVSLVEIVASIVLITIILTSFYYLFSQNMKVSSYNIDHHTVSAVAREISAEITRDCSLVISDAIPSLCTYDSSSTKQGITFNGYPYQIIHDEALIKKTDYYILRKVTIKVWDKSDDFVTDTPKIVSYTFQREVIK